MVIAIYDGFCAICLLTRAIVTKLDRGGRVRFVDVHDSATLYSVYPEADISACMGEIHVLADGKVYTGIYGTRRIFKAVWLLFPLWALLRLPFLGDKVGGFIYRQIARHRYRINRLLGMPIPDGVLSNCESVCSIPVHAVREGSSKND